MGASKTLREITGMGHTPTTIGKSALVLIDCQTTYREGLMQLDGIELPGRLSGTYWTVEEKQWR